MKTSTAIIADIAIGAIAGLAASKATEYVQTLLYAVTPKPVKEREEQVRPGDPSTVAARKAVDSIGVSASDEQIETTGTAIHYGLGAAWGPVYTLLRRHSGMTPLGAAVVTGASMSLIVDEALTPAMGFSAPSRDYPASTHVRGFAAHLAFGAIVAAIAEVLYKATDIAPRQAS